ncbi:MAG: 1,4-beta-xylanase, partial [Promethearchaeota archaeon]
MNTDISDLEKLTWAKKKATEWYAQHPWLVGCNYIPSNAINQLEMFQADTFDSDQIDKELGWAQSIGFNLLRIYLHYLLWEQDASGLKKRMKDLLEICEKHRMKVLFVFFDDCWVQDPKIGKQPEPIPGVHNSGWAASPGSKRVVDKSIWPM